MYAIKYDHHTFYISACSKQMVVDQQNIGMVINAMVLHHLSPSSCHYERLQDGVGRRNCSRPNTTTCWQLRPKTS